MTLTEEVAEAAIRRGLPLIAENIRPDGPKIPHPTPPREKKNPRSLQVLRSLLRKGGPFLSKKRPVLFLLDSHLAEGDHG